MGRALKIFAKGINCVLLYILSKEKEQEQNKYKEESIHDQVERVVLILLINFFNAFHDLVNCMAANYKK